MVNITIDPITKPEIKQAITPLEIYMDGACQPNPGAMTIGIQMLFNGKQIWEHHCSIGEGTNNQAEFAALLQSLKALKQIQDKYAEYRKECTIYTDSQLVARAWKEKRLPTQASSAHYFKESMTVLDTISIPIQLQWIPREQNQAADFISKPKSNLIGKHTWN